jgi:hypothetical protein
MRRLHPKHDTKIVTFRLPQNEYLLLEREAKKLNMSVSNLMRKKLASGV